MKNINEIMKQFLIFVTNVFLFSCGEPNLNKINDYNIESIEIYNRSRDTSIANTIIISKQELINDLVEKVLDSKKTVEYNIKANNGFVEIVIISKNFNRLSMSYIFTNQGEVLIIEGNSYLNKSLINYIRKYY